jgi:hypothetical protein
MSNWIVANKLDHEIDLKSNSVLNFNIKENASACLLFWCWLGLHDPARCLRAEIMCRTIVLMRL